MRGLEALGGGKEQDEGGGGQGIMNPQGGRECIPPTSLGWRRQDDWQRRDALALLSDRVPTPRRTRVVQRRIQANCSTARPARAVQGSHARGMLVQPGQRRRLAMPNAVQHRHDAGSQAHERPGHREHSEPGFAGRRAGRLARARAGWGVPARAEQARAPAGRARRRR